jgi:glycerol-3-phosphate dehydrogenase (NAD(P)+)
MVFSSFDAVGVQTCGAVKNVIAIGFGILDSLMEFSESFGDNTESLLLAAGINEIQMIGRALGSTHDETFTSIAGVGDLDVTCRSIYGRNRRFGKEIVLGRVTHRFKNIRELIENIDALGYLPEGAIAAKYVQELAVLYDLKLPICDAVYKILNKEIEPLSAVRSMLHRLTGITGKDFLP